MRQKIIAGNWKMNLSLAQAIALAEGIKKGLSSKKSPHKIIVFPSFLHIPIVSEILKNTSILVGIQNIYPTNLNAYTGESCIEQAKDFGVTYVLIGHSERRQFLGEKDQFLNQKVIFTLKEGLTPMLCVGETLQERESNNTFNVIKTQLIEGFKSISSIDASKVTIAYEPVWAIGTGKVATPEQAEEVHKFIRQEIQSLYNKDIADNIQILYGGSVKPDNVQSLLSMENIDGGLVGGASQKTELFLALI